MWAQPLHVYESMTEVAQVLAKEGATVKKPIGVFLTLEDFAGPLHEALIREKLLQSGAAKLIVAGTTPFYVGSLSPMPFLIDLGFPDLIRMAVDRLIYRVLSLPSDRLTLLMAPRLIKPA